jgi:hypothetical protein
MRLFTRSLWLLFAPMVWLCNSVPMSSNSDGWQKVGQAETSTSFEAVLTAHGGRQSLQKVTAYWIEATRLTYTTPPEFFERKVTIVVQGSKFNRLTTHPLGLKRHYELFDDQGQFHSRSILSDERGGGIKEEDVVYADTLRSVRFSVETFNLLPMLARLAEASSQARFIERTPAGLNKFIVTVRGFEWAVYTDITNLIRRIEFEGKVFEFANYSQVGDLQLPLFQRVLLGDRPVFDMMFSRVDVNPTLAQDYFTPAAWSKD